MTTITAQPFALSDTEKAFGIDDTTWQFLRISDEYRKAFRLVSKMPNHQDALETILNCLDSPLSVRIASAQDTTCWQKFGIAAWLDPDHELLPELHDGDSWFFPLKRPVQEDFRRKDVGVEPPEEIVGPVPVSYPLLLVEETPFGYRRIRRSGPDARYASRAICVAIDCSVPPNAQISTLEVLAYKHREYWTGDGIQTTHAVDVVVADVDSDTMFSRMKFRRAHVLGVTKTDTAHLWRVVCIDTLGAIGKQISKCRTELQAAYRENRENNIFEDSWPERFLHQIPPAPKHGKAPKDSSMLKALIRLAQEVGSEDYERDPHLVNNIAKKIDLYPEGTARPEWSKYFHEQMQTLHLPLAQRLKNGLYKWLVHAEITYGTE